MSNSRDQLTFLAKTLRLMIQVRGQLGDFGDIVIELAMRSPNIVCCISDSESESLTQRLQHLGIYEAATPLAKVDAQACTRRCGLCLVNCRCERTVCMAANIFPEFSHRHRMPRNMFANTRKHRGGDCRLDRGILCQYHPALGD